MRTPWFALIWGFAEATLFFVVPDVLITCIALRNLRRALMACGFAGLGAVAGGTLMYLWGARDHDRAEAAVEQVPAISRGLMIQVREQMRDRGPIAVTIGSFTGWPYKVYAVEARAAGIDLPAFAAVTIPARLSRFVLLALVAAFASQLLSRYLALRWRYVVLAAIWMVNYALYWSLMPG